MFVQLICKNVLDKKSDEYYQVLGALALREQVAISELDNCVMIEACPQGKIFITEEGNDLVLRAHTRHAGPGFHAFVVNLFKALQEEIEGEYILQDDLEFDQDEDFHRLYHAFEDELEYLRETLIQDPAFREKNYIYDETYYLPVLKENRILTSIGDLDFKEFCNMDIDDLMNYFYVWNDWDKDAQYFKNAALTLLCKEGHLEHTTMNEKTIKDAHAICDLIELAHKADDSLTLPIHEYDILCSHLGRDNQLDDCPSMDEEVICYRENEVYHLFDDVKVFAPGTCERSFDPVSQSLILMSPYTQEDQWNYVIQASKQPICFHLDEVLKQDVIHYDQKLIWIYDWQEEGIYYIEAKVAKGDRALYFHVLAKDKKDLVLLSRYIKESGFIL